MHQASSRAATHPIYHQCRENQDHNSQADQRPDPDLQAIEVDPRHLVSPSPGLRRLVVHRVRRRPPARGPVYSSHDSHGVDGNVQLPQQLG